MQHQHSSIVQAVAVAANVRQWEPRFAEPTWVVSGARFHTAQTVTATGLIEICVAVIQ